MSTVYTEADVSEHNSEKSCWLIIGNEGNGGRQVYDVTKYLNDHPGGPEIMLDLAGKDADEMFEDIGHSSEARTKLKEYLIGTLKFDPDAPKPAKGKKAASVSNSGGGLNPIAVILLLLAIAAGVYFSQQK